MFVDFCELQAVSDKISQIVAVDMAMTLSYLYSQMRCVVRAQAEFKDNHRNRFGEPMFLPYTEKLQPHFTMCT